MAREKVQERRPERDRGGRTAVLESRPRLDETHGRPALETPGAEMRLAATASEPPAAALLESMSGASAPGRARIAASLQRSVGNMRAGAALAEPAEVEALAAPLATVAETKVTDASSVVAASAQSLPPASQLPPEGEFREARLEPAAPRVPPQPDLSGPAPERALEAAPAGPLESAPPAAEHDMGLGPAAPPAPPPAALPTSAAGAYLVAAGAAAGGMPVAPGGAPGSPAGAPPSSPSVSATSPGELLDALAHVPPSAFGGGFDAGAAAAPRLQAEEKIALAKSLPEIERPTGLPRGHVPGAGEQAPGALETPELPGAEQRVGVPPTVVEAPSEPLPTARVSTAADEPVEEGSWWSWLVDRLRRFLSSLPTRDPSLSTSAGERPSVDLSGDADPSLNAARQTAAERQVGDARARADADTNADFGENDIYPDVPVEMLRSSIVPAPSVPGPAPAGAQSGPVSEEARATFDANASPWLTQQLAAQREEYRSQEEAYRLESDEVRAEGERRIEAATKRARGEQEELVDAARTGVDAARTEWRERNRELEDGVERQSATSRQEVDRQISEQVRTTERRSDEKLRAAEERAEAERRRTEAEAAAKKREEESRPRSWWESAIGAIGDFFDAIKEALDELFDALRAFVRRVIDEAKAFVRGLIEAARQFVVGVIRGFGEFVSGLVSVALAAFPETAAAARRWIDRRVDDAVDGVNAAADVLKEAADAALDWVGEALDTALSVLQAAFNFALDVLRELALLPLRLMQLVDQLIQLQRIVETLIALIEDPSPIVNAIREFFAGLFAQIPAAARGLAESAITFSDPPPDHLDGIWRHLESKLEMVGAQWWEILKNALWELVWPLPGVWKELKELGNNLAAAGREIWDWHPSTALDRILDAARNLNGILGRLYGWFFLGMVIGYAIAGGIAAVEVGVLPGVLAGAAAGAAAAGSVGIGLLVVAAATEGAILAKAGFDLVFTTQNESENEEDYERIASSSLTLSIMLVMYVLSELAARLAQAVASWVARSVWRLPALRGRGPRTRGDVIEFRIMLSERVLAVVRGQTVRWLEVIRRNFPVIDLLEGGTITRIVRPGRAPLYRINGGRLISVKSTAQVGDDAVRAINGWTDDLAGFTTVRNVTVQNPSGRTLIVAVERDIDAAALAAIRAHAQTRGVQVQITTALPPNHPAVIFPDQLPAILGEAGVVAAEEARDEGGHQGDEQGRQE